MDLKVCSCCGQKTLPKDSVFMVCKVCGWEDDEIQNLEPDYAGGANHISLNEAKKAWAEGRPLEPLMRAAWEQFAKEEEHD
jgi:anaerobic ribonucleoside-triphosphate reductase